MKDWKLEYGRDEMTKAFSEYLSMKAFRCFVNRSRWDALISSSPSNNSKGDKIRLVLDNLKVHTSEATKKYLATVPGRFEFVFTPKHGSWLNMVEGFFSKMTKQMLRGIRVKYKQELTDRIYTYFDEVNAEPVVFHWKYKLDDIDVSEEPHVETLLPA